MSTEKPDEEKRAKLAAAYDKFAERVAASLASGRERSAEAFEEAMETARAKLTAAGEFSAAQGEDFKRFLRRDFGHLSEEARALGNEAKQRLDPGRLRDGALAALASALRAGGETLQAWSHKADETIIYESGQITSAGTLTCMNCGCAIQLKESAHVPTCPACLSERFRKSY